MPAPFCRMKFILYGWDQSITTTKWCVDHWVIEQGLKSCPQHWIASPLNAFRKSCRGYGPAGMNLHQLVVSLLQSGEWINWGESRRYGGYKRSQWINGNESSGTSRCLVSDEESPQKDLSNLAITFWAGYPVRELFEGKRIHLWQNLGRSSTEYSAYLWNFCLEKIDHIKSMFLRS
jgi:formate-dependent nitrite reductase cytochrome c552 subunit